MRYCLAILIAVLSISGCTVKKDTPETKMSLLKTANPPPVVIYNQQEDEQTVKAIKETVRSFDEIYDTAIIKGKDKCLVAIKVRHMQRFRMKKIEKQLKETLKEKFADEKFTVSSDYKIFLEAIRLHEEIEKKDLSEKEMEKRLKKIIQLSKEKT